MINRPDFVPAHRMEFIGHSAETRLIWFGQGCPPPAITYEKDHFIFCFMLIELEGKSPCRWHVRAASPFQFHPPILTYASHSTSLFLQRPNKSICGGGARLLELGPGPAGGAPDWPHRALRRQLGFFRVAENHLGRPSTSFGTAAVGDVDAVALVRAAFHNFRRILSGRAFAHGHVEIL